MYAIMRPESKIYDNCQTKKPRHNISSFSEARDKCKLGYNNEEKICKQL